MVSGAGSKVSDIGREEDAGNVLVMGLKLGDRDERGYVPVLDHAPDEYVALSMMQLAKKVQRDEGGDCLPDCCQR